MSLCPAIEFKNVTKIFGDVVANNEVSFSVPKGTIRALIGENGAGKSTAMKVLFGLYQKDGGQILVNGVEQHWHSPRDAIAHRIGMVHQHFMLSGRCTALDNIILGEEKRTVKFPFLPAPFNIIDRKKARQRVSELAKKYGLEVPLDKKVRFLSVGEEQRIEILKLLYRDAEILILDEPTAVLAPHEVDALFFNLKKLRDEGKTIIVVTHKLREVLEFTDSITVFRGGRMVGELNTCDATEEKLAELMVGRKMNLHPSIPLAKSISQPVFQVEEDSVSLSVRSGEIVGIAGVEGNGQSELLRSIFLKMKHSNFGFIPEDRHKEGLLLNMSAIENYMLGRHREKIFCRAGFLQKAKVQGMLKQEMAHYDVRPPLTNLKVSGFSGGNQQKIIIAREFGKNPHFIVAANPTRGVDIGAIEFIHNQIVARRDAGAGVLLVSSELDEITKLADRILVMYRGKFVAEFKRGEASDDILGLAMCGGTAK